MRILSISTLFPRPEQPSFGIFVGNQMRAVAARGDVDLAVVSPIGVPPWPLNRNRRYRDLLEVPARSDEVGLPVAYPPYTLIPSVGRDSNPGRIVDAILRLVRAMHAEKPFDIVDAQFFFPDGPAAAAIARELSLPLSIKARGADIHFFGARPRALRQMQDAARQAAGMLAVSQALRADMIALGMPEDRIAIHYTGLDRERFYPMERRAARALVAALPELSVTSDGPLIVTPGSLIPRKSQNIVIEALCELPDAVLALAGAGDDEAALRALARERGVEDRVQFLGLVSHELLPNLLSAADIVALPSSSEGLANVWVEALACGSPLVIPDIGGAREIVVDRSAGRIAERTAPAFAAAIREILNDPPEQEAVAANATRFSWEANAEELVDYWRGLIARSR